MGRIIVKGGVWKNTEDEILKAAVMKYGKNQWSRIASLLHRKSAKQCKMRWFEYLDPSIKKTEWSREEEEKLLHLAKLMPTQWRTIAPIIGRTAAQCLEHYERLLDQAQAAETGVEFDPEDDPRRLRPGEIDPNPHTKPARPDPIDMDEDEKEMLSEARARLANTQGKKAKRKAREKALEEARRLARLQKRRELRAAGIETYFKSTKRKRRQIDYNEEIPFYKKPAIGFWDPNEDDRDASIRGKPREFSKLTRTEASGGPTRDEEEEKARKQDKQKLEAMKKKDMTRAVMQVNKIREAQAQARKRSKLVLPAPQVSDAELEELVKLGQSADAAGSTAAGPTGVLLQDYSQTPGANLPNRTPRTPALQDSLLTEAQNILALNQTSSVLSGGANTPLHEGGGFDSMTPQHQGVVTPNRVLSTPFRSASTGGATPSRAGLPGATDSTPLRDKLSINTDTASVSMTPRTAFEKQQLASMRAQLREGLSTLPKPKRDYDIVVPEAGDDEEDGDLEGFDMEEDAADRDERFAERRRQAQALKFRLQSQVKQRELPIPKDIHYGMLSSSANTDLKQADETIKREMLTMLERDQQPGIVSNTEFSEDELGAAKALLQSEMDAVRADAGHEDPEGEFERVWEENLKEIIYIPSKKRFGRASLHTTKDKLESLEHEMQQLSVQMANDAKRANKMEKKLKTLTMGYQKIAATRREKVVALHDQLDEASLQYATFQKLRELELQAIPIRLERLTKEKAEQSEKHAELQARYRALSARVGA
eukprot:m.26874 g.26874  ORF g.26874 m.26874 type:complete len:768 (+) comp4683_c0_seq1:2177-4480(+)